MTSDNPSPYVKQKVSSRYFDILLIDIFDTNLKKSLTNFLSLNIAESLKQYFKIFILYISLTFIIFLVLSIFGLRFFDSFNLSMTVISSGGFLPVNNLSEIINTNTKETQKERDVGPRGPKGPRTWAPNHVFSLSLSLY